MKLQRVFKLFFPVLIFTLLLLPSPSSKANAKVIQPTTDKAATYITSFQQVHGKWVAKFDYIQWYFGKAADREFLKDCKCSKEMDHAPDGYWIRNVNPKIRTFTISKNAQYVLQTRSLYGIKWNEKVTRSQFITFLKQRDKHHQIPFHIEIKNGIVTKITEQYIP
ncbi:hypothetical protein J7E79_07340 [Bacillus sp. ISL-40]|uniref:hypothetical protein n=1 Tax=unclassified Bacillus (in: firmicutes) TaxID=185979 RepID=UPI001BE772A2|nr:MULTISPECIES: hypothetical protein [unclassified Bacillus (in: firmicutes)]MBT2697223.1 hypothetical protein [Bacillus sp. ISL-40]MBT2720063.1 hypothetical protein [Bacillus sp. ISL-46]MBT2740221.1 hypothetical protein [Bacillus sp. ISL-77]